MRDRERERGGARRRRRHQDEEEGEGKGRKVGGDMTSSSRHCRCVVRCARMSATARRRCMWREGPGWARSVGEDEPEAWAGRCHRHGRSDDARRPSHTLWASGHDDAVAIVLPEMQQW